MNISMKPSVGVLNNLIDDIATSLPNKGNFCRIKQYRTISLFSRPRIMLRVVLNGIKVRLAELLSEEQM